MFTNQLIKNVNAFNGNPSQYATWRRQLRTAFRLSPNRLLTRILDGEKRPLLIRAPVEEDGATDVHSHHEERRINEDTVQEGTSQPTPVDGRAASAQNTGGTQAKDEDPAKSTADGASLRVSGGQVLRSDRKKPGPIAPSFRGRRVSLFTGSENEARLSESRRWETVAYLIVFGGVKLKIGKQSKRATTRTRSCIILCIFPRPDLHEQ